ncbi:MAG: SDR family oxidoreductase [Alicyclobacillus sp.]|nr:SDR family oxidoreductase [Alicyclobacillus sp.]
MGRFERRVAVVTGAARGIGAAIARRLAQDGAAVLLADVDLPLATETAKKMTLEGFHTFAVGVDVRYAEDIDRIPLEAQRIFGNIPDIVVCNAGIQTFKHIEDITVQEWDDVFDVNARGTFLTMRMAASTMKAFSRKGVIITVASIQGRLGNNFYAHYAASKAAVISLTKSFALAVASVGIRVNCVAPGVIQTDLWAKADEELSRLRGLRPGEAMSERIRQVPLGRAGTPEDVADVVAFLASDEARYVTGECVHVCGGDIML